jgi:hypothetical protein
MPYTIKQLLNLPGTGLAAAGHCSLPVTSGHSGGGKITRAANVPTLPPLPSHRAALGGNIAAFTQAPTNTLNKRNRYRWQP